MCDHRGKIGFKRERGEHARYTTAARVRFSHGENSFEFVYRARVISNRVRK